MKCYYCKNKLQKDGFCPSCDTQQVKGTSKQAQIPTQELVQNFSAGVAFTQAEMAKAKMEAGSDFASSHNANSLKKTNAPQIQKGVDNFQTSKAIQGKYSKHLVAKSSASDFGNNTLSKRWRYAENITNSLLLLSSLLLLVSLFMPFFAGQRLMSADEFVYGNLSKFSGLAALSFDFGSKYGIIATMVLCVLVLSCILCVLSTVKLVANTTKTMDTINILPITALLVVIALLLALFSIVCYATINTMIADTSFIGLLNPSGNAGIDIVLAMIASIATLVFSIIVLLTRIKINRLNRTMS